MTESANAKMNKLIKLREKYFSQVQNISDICTSLSPDKIHQVKSRIEKLDSLVTSFDDVQNQIMEVNSSLEQPVEYLKVQNAFDNLVFAVKGNYYSMSDIVSKTEIVNPQLQIPTISKRLPVLEIPFFNGDISSWAKFYSMYESVIHNDPHIDNLTKFHYLRHYVQGNALSVISNFDITAENYILAFEALKFRFQSKRRLASLHLQDILDYKYPSTVNAKSLQEYLSVHKNSVSSLKTLRIKSLEDFMLFFISYRNLHPSARKLFEGKHPSEGVPTFDQLMDFITSLSRTYEISSFDEKVTIAPPPFRQANQFPKRTLLSTSQAVSSNSYLNSCPLCKESHRIYLCPLLIGQPLDSKYMLLKKFHRCFNCLGNHNKKDCKSTNSCFHCQCNHHTILHPDDIKPSNNLAAGHSSTARLVSTNVKRDVKQSLSCNKSNITILGTISLQIKDSKGVYHSAKAVLDCGSHITAITSGLATTLGLKYNSSPELIGGIDMTVSTSYGTCPISVRSRHEPDLSLEAEASVLKSISYNLPSRELSPDLLKRFSNLKLADESFITPSRVDILFGADTLSELLDNSLPMIKGDPTAIPSIFGWIILGKIPIQISDVYDRRPSILLTNGDLQNQLQSFWKTEAVPSANSEDPEHVLTRKHFHETLSRADDGRFIVRLPFRLPSKNISLHNKEVALRLYSSQEYRLSKNPLRSQEYNKFLLEYFQLGHMSIAQTPASYIIPHHAVIKESSSTTKLRVVFNASHKCSPKDSSLNDTLLNGGKVQRDLTDILIGFRKYKVALCADMKKMYRQILVHPDDRKWQHIYWRSDPNLNIEEYELNTLTYGTRNAAFHAQMAIKELAEKGKNQFPVAATILLAQTYMDDVVGGADSVEEAICLKEQLIVLLSQAQIELRKWCSSHSDVLPDLPSDALESPLVFSSQDVTIIILGLVWSPVTDSFKFRVSTFQGTPTKRSILSYLARIFDPLGFLAPLVFNFKYFIQLLWRNNMGWDESLPNELNKYWYKLIDSIEVVSSLSIPRLLYNGQIKDQRLVGFSDASERGYSCVIYLITEYFNDYVNSAFLMARTKVAPVKTKTIPCLELLGAHLLAKTIHNIRCNFSKSELSLNDVLCTDSSVVLSWLHTPSHRLKTFVCNRVVHILKLTSLDSWRHVPGLNNPADCASRGLTPRALLSDNSWFSGPSDILNLISNGTNPMLEESDIPELKSETLSLVSLVQGDYLIKVMEGFSSYSKLLHVIALLFRFSHNSLATHREQSSISGPLSTKELRQALNACVRCTQGYYFPEVLTQRVPKALLSLDPFLDENHLLRVGGRLKNSHLIYDHKHPFILPKDSHLSNLVCDHFHKISLHSGPQTVHALILSQFWIVSARSIIRMRSRLCVTCERFRGVTFQPKMADLPPSRVLPSRPFSSVGTDFSGDFKVKTSTLRKASILKGYLCIFVCMATKAVHLEFVSSLTTDAFLATLNRFVSRRGLPSDIYSDNGRNYVGASRKLKEVTLFLKSSSDVISQALSIKGIQWHFSPPLTPHFNGLFEAVIKSAKNLVYKIIGENTYTFEQYTTLFTQIEAILNSRPLCGLPVDGRDSTDYLSPGHFLIGAPLLSLPERSDLSEVYPSRRWSAIQALVKHFWSRWSKEYLNTISQRHKWKKDEEPIKIGDVVFIKGENTSPLNWPIARVLEIYPGSDGQVRVVKLKTSGGTYALSVHKLFTNSLSWRNHIDWQIYKVVECQYRSCLQDTTTSIDQIAVELYISEKMIKCRPSLAQLKKEFLMKLKTKFLLFPKSLPYFGDENIYATLIEHNSSNMGKGFQRGSLMFEKLQNYIKSLYDWGALVTIDADTFMEMNVVSSLDWERNLKTSKFLAQELTKFSRSPVKVKCFLISMNHLWDDLENENRKFWKKLISHLRGTILSKIIELELFIKEEMTIINDQPKTVEEFVQVHLRHQQLLNDKQKTALLLNEIDDLHIVLKTWTGEVMPQTANIKAIWTNYQSALSTFSNVFASKAESIKKKLLESENDVMEEINQFSEKWNELKPSKEHILSNDGDIEVEKYFTIIKNLKVEWLTLHKKIIQMKDDFNKLDMDIPDFGELQMLDNDIQHYEEIWSIMQDFKNDVKELAEQEWILVRKNINKTIDSFISEWKEKLKEQEFSTVSVKIQQGIDQFQGIMPYLKYLQGETFTEKHWHEIFQLFQKKFKPVHQIVVGDLLFSIEDIENKLNELKEINNRASAEVVIRQALAELDIWEVESKFQTASHTDSKGNSITIIKDFKSVTNKIGDNHSLLQSIVGAAGTAQFMDRISIWENKLNEIDQLLKHLSSVQQKWVYLEPILSKSSLEQSRFGRVSKEFRHTLSQIGQYDFRVTSLLKLSSIGSILENNLSLLDHCQKSLLNFLEEKRLKFPRFYFVSDSDLLEMLGQPNKEDVLQSNLKKVFPGVHSVIFNESGAVTEIASAKGEIVKLRKSVAVSENIEVWLENLGQEMKSSLKLLLLECLDEGDPLKFPSQILCLAQQIHFTKHCEEAITSRNLKNFQGEVMKKYNNYTNQITKLRKETTDTNATLLILKLESLLIDSIEHLHRIQHLIDRNVTAVKDWNWEKCTRFYINDERDVTIQIADAPFNYSYEYQGNEPKLVHTSLTDKCYITLTQALFMGFGGNPYGPAGTGKTESVKSLGALLGRQVLVFNCDEGLDVESLTRIMVGIVKCGAFGCFDEFNRLEEKTLSLISLQISEIQEALKTKLPTITLLNKQVDVNFNSGIFITLNPAGKGYGGRQKLPESLKSLFRPVMMSKPDDTDIASVILHCQGFKQAEKIARKLVTVFEMAKNILPQRGHYDWGLRALKTVVSGCGHFLKEYLLENEVADERAEFKLVVQAVLLNTLCKLTYADGKQFIQLLTDVFPGVEVSSVSNEYLQRLVDEAFDELKLTRNDRQAQKCLELYELMKQRMGVVIVGPAKSGKSTIISILEKILIKQGAIIRHDKLNPKSISKNELLGFIDLDTRHWNDGILTSIAQKVYNEQNDVKCWIHCDGDVDPEWIESLNSVLDDNHLLTLPSGWRIKFGGNVNFIFQTHQLLHASPATISRMGIVLLSEEDLNVDLIIEAWLNSQSLEQEFRNFIYKSLNSAFSWIREYGKFTVNIPFIRIMMSCLSLMDSIHSKAEFAVNLINGLGGNLTKESKIKFHNFVQEITEESSLELSGFLDLYYDEERDMIGVYEQRSEPSSEQSDLIPVPFHRVAIDLVTHWLKRQEPVLIVGPSASGKRLLIRDCVKNIYNTELITVECNQQLFTSHILNIFHQICLMVVSNTRRIYRPRNTEKLIIHFSHINLLYKDKWGSMMVLEFLKQATTENGFYDDNLEWVSFQNINFIYTVTSIENLSTRFISSNHVFYIREPVTVEMDYIYNCYLKNLYPNLEMPYELSNLMVSIFQEVQRVFSGSKISFSSRDITKWCKNLNRYTLENKDKLSEAFLNEARRLLKDKLIYTHEFFEFEKIIKLKLDSGNGVKYFPLEGTLYICDKSDGYPTSLTKTEIKKWSDLIEKSLLDYEGDIDDGNPVLTPDILFLISKLECILTEPGGSVLLGGRVGIGRKTALKIISKRHNATIYLPKIGEKYTEKQFKNDLKNAMQLTGINGEQCYFFLEDYQLDDLPFVLNILSCIISSGEVPGLYSTEEFNTIITTLKSVTSENNFEGTLSHYFKKRVCENFHLILSFDIDNQSLIKQFKENPVLDNGCYLIRMWTFSDEAMFLIPLAPVASLSVSKEPRKDNDSIVKTLSEIHKKAEKVKNTSPFSFFTLIKTYVKMYKIKKEALESRQTQLKAGISKITEAQNVVEELKQAAREQKALLQEKQAKSNAVLDQISSTMANASMKKSEMEELRRKTEEENITLQLRKQEIDKELADIEPILQEARAAVGNIKSESLTEIRSLRAPTTVIRDILEAVLRLMGIQDTSWNSMKTFLSQRGIRDEIRSFDASQITKDDRNAVDSLLQSRKDSFLPANAKRASLAAAPLAAWVTANVQYSLVLEKIRPLTTEQNKLEKNIVNTDSKIQELGTGLDSVNEIVAKLQDQLKASTKDGAEIEIHLQEAQRRSVAAEELVRRLSDEYKIWLKEDTEINEILTELWKNCIISAAFVTYLSDVSERQRSLILEEWKCSLNIQIDFSLNNFLSSDNEFIKWTQEGLPSDNYSRQNGIITLNSIVAPVLLDPLLVAETWLKNHFKNDNITIISLHSSNFITSLDLSIRFGKTIIVEINNNIPCVLMPILQRNFIYQGTRKMVYVGEKLVDYNDNFKLFLIARDVRIDDFTERLLPCPIINFRTSKAGLSEQLLDCALHVEKPALEQQRLQYIKEEDENKIKLYQMQEDLLEKLAHAQGDILQNQGLLKSLEVTKESANEIKRTLGESSLLKKDMNKERDAYRQLAEYGAQLYFACMHFSLINELYQMSAKTFKKLFENSLRNNQIIESMSMKCKNLLNSIYHYVSRYLLKSDVLTFALHLTHIICPQQFNNNEWDLFIGKLPPLETEENQLFSEENIPPWVEADRVPHLLYLQNSLPELFEKINLKDNNAWLDFMNSKDPKPPKGINLSAFQYVLVMQALRPDFLYSTIVEFVLQSLDLKYIHPTTLKLNKLYSETMAHEPILIITSPGNDPSRDISALALTNKISYVHMVAAGPGCEKQVLKIIYDASRKGDWVIIKNLQLITYWLPILEKELQSFQPLEDFRLWLITEPCRNVSTGFLNICLKITYESPPGIKRNMERIYDNWICQNLFVINQNASKVLFTLAWLHGILQERRTYIPQGWTNFYEFNDADLQCGRDTIDRLFLKVFKSDINWPYLKGLFEISVYGGRISNTYDTRILSGYLGFLFKKDLIDNPSFQIAPRIRIPRSTDIKEHLAVIKSLPDSNIPEFFGLPKNVNGLWEREACLNVIDQLKGLDKNSFQEEVCTFDEQYSIIQPIINHWKKINQEKSILHKSSFEIDESPISIFFNSELTFALSLISCISESLFSLEASLKEGKFVDESTYFLAKEIQAQQVPERWDKIWSGPCNTLLYLQSVVLKSESISNLYQSWKEENNVFDLAHIFNVEHFLAALKQQASRFLKISIENLRLNATIGSSVASIMAGSVIITGLLVEGASISYNKLSENLAESSSISVVPNILFSWIDNEDKVDNFSKVSIPLYLTDRRDKVVADLPMPCEIHDQEKWILSGTAFYIRS